MNDICIAFTNEKSGLRCLIDSENGAVWIYLCDPTVSPGVIGDAPLCTQTPLITSAEFKRSYVRGSSPPLVIEYSTRRAEIYDITSDRISVKWAQDGKSVAVFVDDEPFAMILSGEKMGYSKATAKDGPWGKPWRDDMFWTSAN